MTQTQRHRLKFLRFGVLAVLIFMGSIQKSEAKPQSKIQIDSEDIQHGQVYVPKGETIKDDIVTSESITVDGTVDGDCVSLGGPVSIHGKVLGDIATFGGPVTVSGTVKGDIATLGGPVQISGMVEGDIASLGGPMTLEGKAVILGDIALLGGKLNKSDTASVKGEIVYMDWGVLKRLVPLISRYTKSSEIAETLEQVSPFCRWIGTVTVLVITVGIGLMVILLTLLLPKEVERVARTIQQDFWKSIGIGALILILILPGLILMAVSVLGIPLIPLALLLICAAVLMSLAGFSMVLTERFCASLNKAIPSTLPSVAIGYLLLTSLLIVGKLLQLTGSVGSLLGGIFILANLMALSCAMVVGLGAVWSTRMGSRKQALGLGLPTEPKENQPMA